MRDPSKGLAVFWVEEMPPSIGGIQKRVSQLANGIFESGLADVKIVQETGLSRHGFVDAISVGRKDFIEKSRGVIERLAGTIPTRPMLLYSSKPVSDALDGHIESLIGLSAVFDIVILRVASTRSAELLIPYARRLESAGIKLHCLNSHSESILVREAPTSSVRFHNPGGVSVGRTQTPNAAVFCGRIVPSKNVLNLIKAWDQIYWNMPKPVLHIWGPCLGDYGNSVLQAINVARSVSYMGSYEQSSLHGLDDALLLVLPSLREGASNSLSEALARGIPVIGSNIPGIAEYLPPIGGYTISSPFGPAQIADAVQNSLVDIAINGHAKIAKSIQRWYRSNLEYDAELDELLEILMRLASESARSGTKAGHQ